MACQLRLWAQLCTWSNTWRPAQISRKWQGSQNSNAYFYVLQLLLGVVLRVPARAVRFTSACQASRYRQERLIAFGIILILTTSPSFGQSCIRWAVATRRLVRRIRVRAARSWLGAAACINRTNRSAIGSPASSGEDAAAGWLCGQLWRDVGGLATPLAGSAARLCGSWQ